MASHMGIKLRSPIDWSLVPEYQYAPTIIAYNLRIGRGTETGTLATMHAFLGRHHGDIDPMETVIHGPWTSNQVSLIVWSLNAKFEPDRDTADKSAKLCTQFP